MSSQSDRTFTEAELRIMVHAVVDIYLEGESDGHRVEEILDDQLEVKHGGSR